MKEPVWLLKSALLAVHNMMITKFGGPDGLRDEGLLESVLARPINAYHYKQDVGYEHLVASYAAGIMQNHPFIDGNKRMGFMAAYMFLDLNGLTLNADEASATTMALALASSEIDEEAYAIWLRPNTKFENQN